MPIVPDTKNWTWVLEHPCRECGFDASATRATDVAQLTLANAAAWPAVLARADARERPDDSTWSPLEYAAHVRDVMRVFRERLRLMMEQHDPLFPDWDQDAAAIAERYSEQDPRLVGVELSAAAEELASAFERLRDDAWSRPGRRSDGATFSVETFALYFVHDPVHHLWDVTKRDAEGATLD